MQPTPLVFQPWADGVEWPPAAYSSRTHYLYSHARYQPLNVGITDDPANDALCPGGRAHLPEPSSYPANRLMAYTERSTRAWVTKCEVSESGNFEAMPDPGNLPSQLLQDLVA